MDRAAQDYRVTVEEYETLVEERSDLENWELLDGEPVLNPTPTNTHQLIVRNVLSALDRIAVDRNADWQVMPGIGVRDPGDDTNEAVPDVMIMQPLSPGTNWTSNVIVAFEVLSRWSVRRDLVTKRDFYTRLAPLTHYVVLHQDEMRAHLFARDAGFEEIELTDPDATIDFPALGATLTLRDLYRDVGV